ncbi:Uncharacterised protein [Pseudomonas aeruginosa]|nr:Uncharacterised protein [Pseudomonas aeruginosa]
MRCWIGAARELFSSLPNRWYSGTTFQLSALALNGTGTAWNQSRPSPFGSIRRTPGSPARRWPPTSSWNLFQACGEFQPGDQANGIC